MRVSLRFQLRLSWKNFPSRLKSARQPSRACGSNIGSCVKLSSVPPPSSSLLLRPQIVFELGERLGPAALVAVAHRLVEELGVQELELGARLFPHPRLLEHDRHQRLALGGA